MSLIASDSNHLAQSPLISNDVHFEEVEGVSIYWLKVANIERFNKSFRVEVLDANLFNSISEVQMEADEWLVDYNEYRPYEPLGMCCQRHSCQACLNGMPLVSNCPLVREVYELTSKFRD